MHYPELRKLKNRAYFSPADVGILLGIGPASARVLCSRYAKSGLFVRLKRNFYLLSEAWENFGRDDFLKAANFLQVPSYVSFMTALSFYEATTQVQRDFFESASLKRSAKMDIKDKAFGYYKLKKEHYCGFLKKEGIFIAAKEKAFVDMLYLYSFGKYKFDLGSVDFAKLDRNKIKSILKAYPEKTKKAFVKLCRT